MAAARVLQVVLSLNPGGTERLVIELTRRLKTDIPMAVCCLDAEGAWAQELRALDIPVTSLGRKAGFQPLLGRAVAVEARRHEANVLHCHHYSPFVYGCLARMWGDRSSVIFTEHGRLSDAGASPRRRAVNAFLKHVPSDVVAVSEDLKRHIVAEGFSDRCVRVIHNGIDVGVVPDVAERARVRARMGVGDEVVVIGTVARLDPVKDLGTLIRAMATTLSASPLLLLIVGDGPERESLTQLAADVGLIDRVRFFGYREDARDWLHGCDVYVNSSISEGVSLTILEAMAAMLPIVATAVGGTPEVVTSDCGVLVPARNPDALATAIRRLAADAHLRRALGAAARDRVVRRFTLDRMVADYRAAYVSAA